VNFLFAKAFYNDEQACVPQIKMDSRVKVIHLIEL